MVSREINFLAALEEFTVYLIILQQLCSCFLFMETQTRERKREVMGEKGLVGWWGKMQRSVNSAYFHS